MAIQDVRRSEPLPSVRIDDPVVLEIYNSYYEASLQLNNLHNRIQEFEVAVANGTTSKAVTFELFGGHPTFTTSYYVGVEFALTNGGCWITNKTTTSCTVNWATALGSDSTIRLLIVE